MGRSSYSCRTHYTYNLRESRFIAIPGTLMEILARFGHTSTQFSQTLLQVRHLSSSVFASLLCFRIPFFSETVFHITCHSCISGNLFVQEYLSLPAVTHPPGSIPSGRASSSCRAVCRHHGNCCALSLQGSKQLQYPQDRHQLRRPSYRLARQP